MGATSMAAIVLAGGAGTRMGGSTNKAYLPVGGRALITWSLRTLEAASVVDEIVIVARKVDTERIREVLAAEGLTKVTAIVEGGATRHDSEFAGLSAIAPRIEADEVELVCVHDAARPFVSAQLVARVASAASAHGGAVPCLPFSQSRLLRVADDSATIETVATASLRRVQTPQAFRARALLEAHRRAAEAKFKGFDTAECVDRFGHDDIEIRAVAGDDANLKVTFSPDLTTAAEHVSP